jgi:hypothetical protein
MSDNNDTPTILEKASNLVNAVIEWAENDFENVPKHVFNERLTICQTCEFWNPKGWFGLGECTKCGCSAAKLYLPDQMCPLLEPKWSRYVITTPSASLDTSHTSSQHPNNLDNNF